MVTDNSGATDNDVMQVTVNPAPNQAPNANAGPNKTITLPVNKISLSGSGSDADGTVTSYKWTKISGPSAYNIVNASSPVTDVTGLVEGVYQFELKITDNDGATDNDIMQVTVKPLPNQAPDANAGPNKTITLPVNTISLSGSGSDTDGTVVIYKWTKISGPSSYNIINAFSPATDVTGLVEGVYQFELKVTDNYGATDIDVMQVTVNPAPNTAPNANAGSDKTITLPVNTTSLSGNGSDADGTVTSYKWTKISGPSGYNIVNAASPVTDVTGLVEGVYQFELKVTDNGGATGTDVMKVTVNSATNVAPVANAGADKTIFLPVNTTSLAGSGSDPDGVISSYKWTKISGPFECSIVNASSPVTDVTGLVEGIYQFELKVTDNKGATGTDLMTVKVAAANQTPTANAGPDQTITLPTNIVTLSGSGSDPDGTIAKYNWKQISGPAASGVVSPGKAITLSNELEEGSYEFELTVTDDDGASASDTVSIVVAVPRLNLNVPSNAIKVYPNPVIDVTTLEINTTHPDEKLLVVIRDINGQVVFKEELNSGLSNIKHKINMSNMVKGTYLLTVYFSSQEQQTFKIIKL